MKRITTLFTLLLFAGIMLPSCGVTIVKRQHTGGYYVSTNPRHHAGKGEAVRQDEDKSVASAESAATAETEAGELAVTETPATINEQANAFDAPVINEQHDAVPAGPAKASSTKRTLSLNSMTESVPGMKKMHSTWKKVKSNSRDSAGDDGLSLIWILILILLVLWAAGLIGGGWGLGWVINVLLVIALVLLILWLLRIV